MKFGDVIEGVTMSEQLDEVTGLSRRTIVEPKDPDARPRVSIEDEKGTTEMIPGTESHARYVLPVGSLIQVNEGDVVTPGDIIAKIPRETTKTKDITGGLPRPLVWKSRAELFEARKPKEAAVITEKFWSSRLRTRDGRLDVEDAPDIAFVCDGEQGHRGGDGGCASAPVAWAALAALVAVRRRRRGRA